MTTIPPSNQALAIASYNIHRCVGIDRKWDPARIALVLAELASDVIALQEVDNQPGEREGSMQLHYLARVLNMQAISGLRLVHRTGEYGNAVLTRLPVVRSRLHDLSHSRYEPRNALDLVLDHHGTHIRVVAAHLGLNRSERSMQWAKLFEALADTPVDMPTVLLGDMNEWYRRAQTLRQVHQLFGETPAPAAFPSFAPLLALTRIWVRPVHALLALTPHRTPLAKWASDHLPVKATINPNALSSLSSECRHAQECG